MRKTHPVSLSRLIDQRHGLLDQGRRIARLNAALSRLLPAGLAGHCRVANLRDGILVLAADSPAWASRLRFHADKLLKSLNKECDLGAGRVRTIVVPAAALPTRRPIPRKPISSHTARLIEQCADGIGDPALQAALRRLARRSRV